MGQFRALSEKNWILWKRGCCGNIIEVIIPIIFIAFIAIIRKLVTIDTFNEQSFISNNLYTYPIYGQHSTAVAAGGSQFLRNCTSGTIVGLAPSGNAFVSTLNSKLTALGYTTELFSSDADITSRVRSFDYGVATGKFCFAITISEATPGGSYTYKLHFNQSVIGNTDGPATTLKLVIDNALNLDLFQKTKSSGMMGTTTFINNLILQQQTGSTNNVIENIEGPIYQQAYEQDNIYTSAQNNVGILFLLPLLIVYLRQTSVMLSEKQKKIRETMNIMGMQLPVYYVTWFIRYFVTCLVIHLIGSIIIARVLPHVGFIIPFIIFILFDIVIIIQSFFIQTFFTRAKLGVVIALLFFLIQYVISFVSSNSDNPTLSVNSALSIIPHIAFILSFETMLYAESVKINASFKQTLNNYTIGICIISCVLNILVYLFLTWYLEQVFPNEFGSKKHPLFCCFGKKNKVSSQYTIQDSQSDSTIKMDGATKPDVEQVEQKYKVMETEKKIVNIQNLRKQFNDGDFIAVNDLSLKMYNDNIFVLLGHNGAGKTTTISMLTGMLEPTSGLIEVCGETQLQKIRESIGVCPQHDTLYEDLTVREHLELFGTFRGLTGEELDDQVNKLISDVNLYEKRDEYSKNLSGGQKRRLSVAMAFAGRSKVIILDEPTSGMDTSARRYIWELLKSYKSNRIILLTTHFMDEADYLGDRIGIMAGGRLICCGSGHYLKNKFGVGYNITFVKKQSKVPSSNITSTVQRHIPRAILLSDVSSQITMQLPMDEVKKFPALFNEIDSKKDALGITTYGISITTLEQVFLKVGEETHNADQVKKQSLHHLPKEIQNPMIKDKQVPDLQEPIFDKSPVKQSLTHEAFFEDEKLQRVDGAVLRFFIHLKATILKRLRVIKRDYKSFILELLLPMVIIILALLLMQISFIKDLPEQELSLSTYLSQASPIEIPIGSSDSTLLNGIESKLNSKYGSQVSVSKDTSSTTAASFDQNYLKNIKANTKFLMGGLFFNGASTVGTDNVYAYTTIVNTKVPTSSLYLQTLAAQTYINQIQGSNVTISIVNSPFARTNNQLQINNTISGFFAALIFSIALGFKFASIISFIVKERQDKSKHQQIVSGMNIAAYWLGNFIYDYLLYLVLAIFSFAMCQALSVGAFTGQAYGVTVLVFILYGLAYIPFTYIIAYLFKDYGNAQAGFYFFTFVVGGLLSIVVLMLRFLGGDANTVGLVLSWIFRFIPSYCFGQILINLGSLNLLSIVELGAGKQYSPWDMKISLAAFIYLIVEIFAYTLLVFLIESAFNNENFMRFWTSQSKIDETQEITDSDVIAMKQKALKADPHEYQILTKNLRKVYMLDSAKKYKVAVDNLSVAIQKGEVFGLLGVNGAGKTTTFKMLAGQITSTSGDSYFTGMKISENLKRVRQNLGYCPQFDALIQNLTVRQQLELFYDLKSLPGQYKDKAVTQKIREMNLQQYEDKLSGTLSGGNKRKLSVAMAMIGNPNIIFLDEPSTGMDPKARRFMWKIISRIASEKKQSTIILTTHSMQQAEALSTKLGIMVNGNFKCIGTPQHIKSKYGDGYEIQIKVDPCTKEQITKYMTNNKLENKITIEERQLQGFLNYLKIEQSTQAQISPKGSGNYIYNQINSAKRIETFQIIEYLLLVDKIKVIRQFMQSRFGGCEVIESFQTFIRFKVKATLSVGKMFEVLENEKVKLEIDSYSIKQATVEQIFNRFAEDGQQSEYMG